MDMKFVNPLVKTCVSYPINIYIAGDFKSIEAVCQEFCDTIGFCVTVTPTSYVYRRGRESGAIIGLINYPQYPLGAEELEQKAIAIGLLVKQRLKQESFTIQKLGETKLYTWRKDHREQ